jgi:Na+-driven multidrug efflux pump
MVPAGVSSAAATLTGNALGAGDVHAAQSVVLIGFALCLLMAAFEVCRPLELCSDKARG